jgi:hypothetical protein
MPKKSDANLSVDQLTIKLIFFYFPKYYFFSVKYMIFYFKPGLSMEFEENPSQIIVWYSQNKRGYLTNLPSLDIYYLSINVTLP